jgi:UMF1 family MFS transporter
VNARRRGRWSRAQWAWAGADLAREPFFSIVLSLIFPPYFVMVVAPDPVRGTVLWGYGLAVASLALVVVSPLAGAAADATGRRKPWIVACALAAVAALTSLWFASAAGPVGWVLASCVMAQVAVELSRVFSDSMVLLVAEPAEVGRLSGLAVGLGFAGCFAYLTAVLLVTGTGLTGEIPQGVAQRGAAVLSGAWFALFILPLLLWCPDFPARLRSGTAAVVNSFRELARSLRGALGVVAVRRFLVARMLYWDGTMALFSFIAILTAARLHWRPAELSAFGLLGLIAGAAGGVAGGVLDQRIGSRRTLLASIATMGVVALTMLLLLPAPSGTTTRARLFALPGDMTFLALAVSACGVLAVIMGSSRAMMVSLSPPARLGEFFGLYTMVGRASSFAAPLLVAAATAAFEDQVAGIFGISLTFLLIGFLLLSRVRATIT